MRRILIAATLCGILTGGTSANEVDATDSVGAGFHTSKSIWVPPAIFGPWQAVKRADEGRVYDKVSAAPSICKAAGEHVVAGGKEENEIWYLKSKGYIPTDSVSNACFICKENEGRIGYTMLETESDLYLDGRCTICFTTNEVELVGCILVRHSLVEGSFNATCSVGSGELKHYRREAADIVKRVTVEEFREKYADSYFRRRAEIRAEREAILKERESANEAE